ncbi:MAG: hypothetical protein ABF876_03920 [Acetobacter aceti]|uniref:Uncharacterized protein n=1 Tax=Acetobacter aceti TaxID=435 RepID=A0A1U9KHZ4_ACEAC|nr:hypothetical protein [Acetobacter aceti]AQS85434.1 hypothetical protein A0U92_12290 [Acetobacter aceti]
MKRSSQADFLEDNRTDHDADEAALRALNRMGSHKANPGVSGSNAPRQNDQQLRLQPRAGQDAAGQFRKRRFVRDGDVQVEHNPFSRPAARTAPAHSGDSETKLNNRAFEAERRARGDAERQVQELETHQRSLETRLGHAQVLVAELKQSLEARETELATLRKELAGEQLMLKQAHAEISNLRQQVRAMSSKKTAIQVEAEGDEEGQKPVKWWKD